MNQAAAFLPNYDRRRAQLVHSSPRDKQRLSLQKSLLLAALVAVLLPATARAQQPPTIEWELVNPFRFIHDQETVDELRAIYDGLSDQSAAGLERKLQNLADAEVDRIRSEANTRFDCRRTTVPAEKKLCFAPYSGWFAKVARNNHEDTCWDSKNHRYRTKDRCADYIYPTAHRVRVWIANPESLGDAVPHWTVAPAVTLDACETKHRGRICREFTIPYNAETPATYQVIAQFPTLPLITEIQVRDKLIVGLGDSYAAGEGNPDIPAQFIEQRHHTDRIPSRLAGRNKTEYPAKDKDNKAEWLDRRCHRSMYSYQFKTALQLALSNPREAITYVSFSCSGAVTPEIIDTRQKANERGFSLKTLDPQLDALREVLRNGENDARRIDFLLLSTGGNDVGFADYVAYILLRKEWLARLVGVTGESIERDFEEKKIENTLWGKDRESGNYKKLQKVLFKPPRAGKPKLIRIAGCESGDKCNRVLLTPYPNVFTAKDKPCEGNQLEFDDSFGAIQPGETPRAQKIKQVIDKVFTVLTAAQSSARVKAELGWTVIDRNVQAYVNHGFCARDDASMSIGEKFQIPTWLNEAWTIYPPRDYRAYQSRARWFRLPVDAKLTADQAHNLPFGIRLRILFEDVTSSVMHPTAEGLARTADLNVEEMRKIEALPTRITP